MSAKHSPGPWRFATDGLHKSIMRAAGADHEAVVRDDQMADADARLIAAAPELLAVVARTAEQGCLCAATYSDVPEVWDPADNCPACAARALIRRIGAGV